MCVCVCVCVCNVCMYVRNVTNILLQKKLHSNALATSLAEGGQALGPDSLLG